MLVRLAMIETTCIRMGTKGDLWCFECDMFLSTRWAGPSVSEPSLGLTENGLIRRTYSIQWAAVLWAWWCQRTVARLHQAVSRISNKVCRRTSLNALKQRVYSSGWPHRAPPPPPPCQLRTGKLRLHLAQAHSLDLCCSIQTWGSEFGVNSI